MSKVTQKDILKDRLDQEGVQILTQVAVHPPQTSPTGDPVGVRGQYQSSSGIVYDPLTGEDKPIAVVSQNGKVVAETAYFDRVFYQSFTVVESYLDENDVEIGTETTQVLREQAPVLYSKIPPIIPGYVYVGYRVGEEDLVAGVPTDVVIEEDTEIVFEYDILTDVTSPAFVTEASNDVLTITLTGGTFKTGAIVAADFEFTGTNADAIAAGTFTRTSDTVVTVTELTLEAASDDVVVVKAETQATQATSVAVVASTAS
jgi:hypothetical protein